MKPTRDTVEISEVLSRAHGHYAHTAQASHDASVLAGEVVALMEEVSSLRAAQSTMQARFVDTDLQLARLRRILDAERGLPAAGPDPAWKPSGGMLLHWDRAYPDGTHGRTRRLGDGTVQWYRLVLGRISSVCGERSEPDVKAEGCADTFYEAMVNCDKSFSGR